MYGSLNYISQSHFKPFEKPHTHKEIVIQDNSQDAISSPNNSILFQSNGLNANPTHIQPASNKRGLPSSHLGSNTQKNTTSSKDYFDRRVLKIDQVLTDSNMRIKTEENANAGKYRYFKSPPGKKGFKNTQKAFNVKGLSNAEKRLVNMSPSLKTKMTKHGKSKHKIHNESIPERTP